MVIMRKLIPSPWQWHVPKNGWFDHLNYLIDSWQPDPRLGLSEGDLHKYLKYMVIQKKDWAFHPCLCALTKAKGKTLRSDLQLVLWLYIHNMISGLNVNIPEELWYWSSTGSKKILRGVYSLETLSKPFADSYGEIGPYVSLDVWGHSTHIQNPNSWASRNFVGKEQSLQLASEIITFFMGTDLLRTLLPECYSWISNVTKVVTPLASYPSNSLHCSHSPEIPGMVYLDLFGGEINTLELLIHESAHLYFFLAELNSKLVQQNHEELYWSPLRNEKRPLQGIFLGYHALSYICAFYHDGISKGFINKKEHFQDRDKHINQMRICEDTLNSAIHSLTSEGVSFLEKTQEISKYALS